MQLHEAVQALAIRPAFVHFGSVATVFAGGGLTLSLTTHLSPFTLTLTLTLTLTPTLTLTLTLTRCTASRRPPPPSASR